MSIGASIGRSSEGFLNSNRTAVFVKATIRDRINDVASLLAREWLEALAGGHLVQHVQ